MAGCWVRPSGVRWLSGLLVSVAAVAMVSGLVALLEPHVPVQSLLVLYLLAVLPVAVVWGTGLAVVTSMLSTAVFAYLFLPPIHSIQVADSRELAAMGVFLVAAVVMGELAARSRRVALESARLSQEQSALRRVATLSPRRGRRRRFRGRDPGGRPAVRRRPGPWLWAGRPEGPGGGHPWVPACRQPRRAGTRLLVELPIDAG
jgi:hypothetical protein